MDNNAIWMRNQEAATDIAVEGNIGAGNSAPEPVTEKDRFPKDSSPRRLAAGGGEVRAPNR